MKNYQEVVKSLVKAGNKIEKDLTVKNVNVKVMENYIRLSLTINREIDGYVTTDVDGVYEEGKTNVIFVSAFSINALLKEDNKTAFAANHLLEHPMAYEPLLSYAKITVVQERIDEGTEYANPFSDAEPQTIDHNTIVNHIIKLELDEMALNDLKDLRKGMMGL